MSDIQIDNINDVNQEYENKIFDLVIYWCFVLVIRGLLRLASLQVKGGLSTELMIPSIFNIPIHICQLAALIHALLRSKTYVLYYILLINFGIMIELIDFDIVSEEGEVSIAESKLT